MHKVYNFILKIAIVNEQNVNYIFNVQKIFQYNVIYVIMLSRLKNRIKGGLIFLAEAKKKEVILETTLDKLPWGDGTEGNSKNVRGKQPLPEGRQCRNS